MKTTLATILIGLAFLIGASFGGYALYERHISTDVRAAILASLGDNVSDADVTVYLRTAKLAIRTKRDAYVVELLDKTVEQAMAARRNNKASWDLTMSGLRNLIPVGCQVYGYGSTQCKRDAEESYEEAKRDRETEKMYDNQAAAEAKEATRLMGILRTEVGLPPIPDKPTK